MPQKDDVQLGLQARIYDPLWMLGRQWQFGEFKAEDAGSPVSARIEADAFGLTRFYPRPLGSPDSVLAPAFDGRSAPLETLVERESMRAPNSATLRLSADAGLHFGRLLSANGLAQYRPAYLTHFAFQPPTPDLSPAYDAASLRFLAPMVGRVIDGLRLAATLQAIPGGDTGLPGLPADPNIPVADRERARVRGGPPRLVLLRLATRRVAWLGGGRNARPGHAPGHDSGACELQGHARRSLVGV